MTDDDGEGEWPTNRRVIAYREGRNVLNAQQSTLADIDDKALRTVRVTALLIGALVAAARISGASLFHPLLAVVSGAFLFLAVGLGVATYSESDLYLGPTGDFIEQLAFGQFVGQEWDDAYLIAMGYWIDENHEDIAWNGKLLLACQSCFVIGLFLAALAVLL